MFKNVLFICIVFLPCFLKAQVSITAQLPAAGMIQKEQLWNLILVNNNEEAIEVSIKFSLQEAVSGQEVMSARTGNLLLTKGVKAISSKDLQPILYNFVQQDFSRSYLPLGAYVACYQVNLNALKEEPLAQECIQINIDPLSPPVLNSPSDQSEIQTPYPQFTWMPPTPFDLFSNLNYDLVVTEVLPGQSSTDAIQNNIPVYLQNNISLPSANYPTTFSALQINKTYAWQVVARNGLNYGAKTEVWTFKMNKQEPASLSGNDTYILLEDNSTGIHHIKKDLLKIKYYSLTKAYTAQVEFTDEKGHVVKKINQLIVPGNNYFDYDLKNRFQTGRQYKISIIDLVKKVHVLTFNIN